MTKIYGPYLRPDGRQHIVIVHDDGRKQTKSYPKYLLEQKLGKDLVGNETCDHVDDDFTNDDPNNLQVLTRAQNAAKGMLLRPAEWVYFTCPVCRKPSKQRAKDANNNRNMGKSGPYCSRECAGLVGKNLIRIETDYDYDPVTDKVTVTSKSWDIP